MKLAIIGATGFVGGHIYEEAKQRGHEIIAISRKTKMTDAENVKSFQQTIFEPEKLEALIKDVDTIISAYNPGWYHIDPHNRYLAGYDLLIKLAKKLNKRLVLVGGATSLDLEDGTKVVEGFFPAPWKAALSGTYELYEKIKDDKSFNWTYVSPAAELINTRKTGNYVLGTDVLVTDDGDVSRVSVQDLADAILNEVEKPQFIQKRFTLGYK